MNFLLDLWNSVMGSNIVEPTIMVSVLFFVIFILLPILCLYLGIKITLYFLTAIRDWWHDGRK